MTLPIDDAILAAARRHLGPHGDDRAREALDEGVLRLERDVTTWESSGGTVRGHRAHLEVPAPSLAKVRASPAAMDALHAAIATAIGASGTGDALLDLQVRWGEVAREVGTPYRGAPPARVEASTAEGVRDALVQYLRTSELEPAAAVVESGAMRGPPEALVLVLGEASAEDVEAVASALSAMLGPDGWRIERGR